MKRIIFTLLLCSCFFLAGCKVGTVTKSGGMQDVSYIEFVSPTKSRVVNVMVDETSFSAKVTKQKRTRIKGTSYAIAPGKRHIVVKDGKNILFDKMIMVSTQETKTILLP